MHYWPSPAKLNLFLHLIRCRSDGYHDLQTVFQLIDYSDELSFIPRKDSQINCTFLSLLDPTTPIVIPNEDNLVIKAARFLQGKNKGNRGVDIFIKKRIPVGGGLGGGSSNAATTLIVLNRLWKINLSLEKLLATAVTLGADVPFFIKGETSWGEGIGNHLQALSLPQKWFVILFPNIYLSTKKLFSHSQLTYTASPIKISDFLSGSFRVRNDFLGIVRQDYPMVASALDFLNYFSPAHLSGTGSSIFAILNSKSQAQMLLEKLLNKTTSYRYFLGKGLNTSPLHQVIKNWGVAKW